MASLRAIAMASAPDTCTTSSTTPRSSTSGTKPAPMPWIGCGPASPPESTALSSGSTATTRTVGFCCLKNVPHPVIVPPVPTPLTKTSTAPLAAAQISGPVVSACTRAFAGLRNCCRTCESGVRAATSSAFATAPAIPCAGSVRTSSAPKARKSTRRSRLMDAGIANTNL